jgi:membrane protein
MSGGNARVRAITTPTLGVMVDPKAGSRFEHRRHRPDVDDRTTAANPDESRGLAVEDRNAGSGVVGRLVASVLDDDVLGLAAEIAYRFLFAVFPFGLFVAALGAFVAAAFHVENPAADVIAGLGDNLPPSIGDSLQPELERLLASARPDLLSVGALGALWAATGGVNALVKGIHRAYGVPESRPLLLRYGVAVALTLLAAIGVLAAFVTVVGGAVLTDTLAGRFGLGPEATAALHIARWPLMFLVLTGAVGILYRYAPIVVAPWRWVLAGSAVFSAGWLVATALLGLYVTGFSDYGATYGSLGGVIILMIWFYVSGALLMVGAEVAAALAWERSPDSIRRRKEEDAATSALGGSTEDAKRAVEEAARRAVPDRLSRPPT